MCGPLFSIQKSIRFFHKYIINQNHMVTVDIYLRVSPHIVSDEDVVYSIAAALRKQVYVLNFATDVEICDVEKFCQLLAITNSLGYS